uniref:Uncharacterized protein n=1 Tax=Davidia involucrata TaxID=16924 RepID=A0A5B7C0T1_DAVIN
MRRGAEGHEVYGYGARQVQGERWHCQDNWGTNHSNSPKDQIPPLVSHLSLSQKRIPKALFRNDSLLVVGDHVRELKPTYAGSCPYIDGGFDCPLHKRADDGFWIFKMEMQPNGFDIPREVHSTHGVRFGKH